MVRMLMTINISKGWETWSKMAKGLEPQMNEQGAKIIWAGANPDVGKQAAIENENELREALADSHMVFITAGFGGGTGTGAAAAGRWAGGRTPAR